MSEKNTVIGIDIGGTKIHGIKMDINGKIFKEIKILTEAKKGYEIVLKKIKNIINDLKDTNVKAIGIGLASPIDHKKGIVINAPNIKGWINIPLQKIISKECKLPVFLENDAKCFTIAEYTHGAGKGYSSMVGVTLGTGIGGGIIIDGKLHRGRDNYAGEIGHMSIHYNRFKCSCGGHGCFEKFASGTAILKRTLDHIKIKDHKTNLIAKGLGTRDIYRAALKEHDPLAIHILKDTGKYLGIGLANIINILNPEIIVLGGSVSRNFDLFEKNMRLAILKQSFSPANNTPIIRSKIDYPGTIGAALIAWEGINK